MRTRPLPRLLAATSLLLVLGATAACGGDDDEPKAKPTPSPTAITGPGSKTEDNLAAGQEFFEAIASHDADQLESAADLVAPGSPAQKYYKSLVTARANGPDTGETFVLTSPAEGQYRLCASDGKDCHKISSILLSGAKVLSFTVDGKPVSAKTTLAR